MLKVGLTGGIGSGKSTVGRLFELLGVPLYKADDAARNIMATGSTVRQQIIDLLGPEAYIGTQPDRKWIASKVFDNKELLQRLNAIVHPAVIAHGEEWMQAHNNYPYVVKEAAILFEAGTWQQLDFVIGVFAPQELRIERTMRRDGVSRDTVLQRMAQQMDEAQKMKLCRYVINNNEQELVIPQVLTLHQLIVQQYSLAQSPAQ